MAQYRKNLGCKLVLFNKYGFYVFNSSVVVLSITSHYLHSEKSLMYIVQVTLLLEDYIHTGLKAGHYLSLEPNYDVVSLPRR